MGDIKFGFVAKDVINEGRVCKNDVDIIKNFVAMENLPSLTDEQLVMFLLSCQNNQEMTKKTILAYYSIKKKCPEIFDDRIIDRNDLQHQLQALKLCFFPKRTPDGYAIIYLRLHDTSYSSFHIAPSFKLLFMILDAAIYDSLPQGLIILFDMKGMGLMHLTRIKPYFLKVIFDYLQEALPVRLKTIHILNSVYFVNKVIGLIKPFIKPEVYENMHFHSSSINMEDFYTNCIPRECLPENYGGYLPSVEALHEENTQKLKDMERYFIAEEEQRKKY